MLMCFFRGKEFNLAKEIMDRRASDNVYLHKDFHGALSAGIEYLHENFGEEAVREYLRRFTLSYFSPLTTRLKKEGLSSLKEYFEQLYAREGGDIETTLSENELVISVTSCPAVNHMRKYGYPVARLFHETSKTVNEALCEGTPYTAEMLEYDRETGRSIQRFYRRKP